MQRAEKLADRLDRVLALRDQELGITADGVRDSGFSIRREERGSGIGVRGSQKDANPELFSAIPENRTPNTGFSANPETRNPNPGSMAPPLIPNPSTIMPVPPPTPGSVTIAQGRGDLAKVFGVAGTAITSGFLRDLGEYNGELLGLGAIRTYEKMRRGDAQVRATLAACKLPVQSAKWEVVPKDVRRVSGSAEENGVRDSGFGIRREERDSAAFSSNPETRNPNPVSSTGAGKNTQAKAKEVAAFVKDNLFGGLEFRTSTGGWSTQNWDEVVRNALLMVDFGCAVHEEVWTVDGDRVRLRKLASRLPLTFYRWHTEADGETLLALEQYGYRGGRFLNVLLPADKMALFTYNREGANFWGIALQRAMYPHWYIKSHLYRIDAIACERNALGVPVWRLPKGFSKEDRDAAFNFVTQLAAHEATGAVEPPGDTSDGFRIVGYQGHLRETMPSIEHHNIMISRAALALFMDLGTTTEHGSRSVGETHGDFFLLALQNLADQVAWEIESTAIRRLVEYNFGEGAPVPHLAVANVQARSLEAITEALTKLATAGLVVSESNLRGFLRSELALPDEGPRDVVAIRGETVAEGGKSQPVAGVGAGSA